jgi:hypothetical protein
MGHESQIEPWSPYERHLACWFRNWLGFVPKQIENRYERNPNFWVHAQEPSEDWPIKTHPAHSTGLESKNSSGDGENFALDFSFL